MLESVRKNDVMNPNKLKNCKFYWWLKLKKYIYIYNVADEITIQKGKNNENNHMYYLRRTMKYIEALNMMNFVN